MTMKYEQDILQKLKRRKLKRSWSRLVTAMMCVVVFCTTYALILPAITQETETFCGYEEEHVHTEECYPKEGDFICEFADTEIHIHTESCNPTLDTVPNCGLEEIEAHSHDETCTLVEEQLICTLEESEGHTHSEACAPVEEKTFICTLAETEGHSHSDACAPSTVQNLICTLAETEGHAHSDACAPSTVQNLICTLAESEEHAHGDGCYTSSTVYGCGLAEAAAHAHTDTCYNVSTVYSCGLEAIEAHTHTDACYNVSTVYGCGLEEAEAHAHIDTCYVAVYSCGLQESEGHAHSEACFPTVYDCGLEGVEHTHIESCYNTSPNLICGLAEDETHTHSAECYDGALLCELEEHEHELECYSDPSADVEDASIWEATLPASLGGTHADNLLAVANSQVGYVESTRNYIVTESGEMKGYTRYGAWAGIPYEDWSAMFVSFCLHYAHVDVIPQGTMCTAWVHSLQSVGMYQPAADYTPVPGDIVFFDQNGNGSADHVGIVASISPAEDPAASRIQTIEGDSANEVRYNSYNLTNTSIVGYGTLVAPQPSDEEEAVEETQPDTSIVPIDTVAWATVVGSVDEAPEESTSTPEAATTYSLRRTASTFRMSARAGTPLDLTPYITSVNMYDANGNPLPSGSLVTEGDLIEFKISYTLTGQQLGVMNGKEYEVKTDTLVYEIPKSFQVVQDSSGNIVNSAGQVVGTFTINSSNGTISMTFSDNYVKDNITGLPIIGHISFFSTVVKITDEDGETQTHKFTDNISLGIVIEEKEEVVGSLELEKQKISVDGELLTYEILVTSTEGTTGPITITDVMSEGLTFKQGISVRDGNNTPVSAEFNPSSDKSSFTMTLPEMRPGDRYVIRYQCEADIELLGADMTVHNTATITGKDNHNNDLLDYSTVEHNFDMLKKTGEKNDDGSITWTITINQAEADISGWILEDIITAETATPYTGPVTIKDSSGRVVAQNATLPYTFPEGSDDTYVITYTTAHGYGGSEIIYNKAILKDDDTDITVVTGVNVGNPFTKSGEAGTLTQDENGNYILPVTWTVTIDTTNGALPAGSEIYDVLQGSYHTGEMYMTYEQLMAAFNSIEAALVSAGSSVDTISAGAYAESYSAGAEYNENALRNNAACRSLLYERFTVKLATEIPKGKIITFSYTTNGIFTNNIVSDTVFKNQVGLKNKYMIEATEEYVYGTVWADKIAMKFYDPSKPNNTFDWALDWNGTEGTSRYNYSDLHDDYLAWAIDVMVSPGYTSTQNVILYEDLPDGLDVKGLDWSFFNSVPTSRLSMKDLVPGNTYTWTFTVYPGEEYFYYTYRNPTEVTVTVEYTETKDLVITMPGEMLKAMGQYAALYKEHTDPYLNCGYGMLYVYTQINDNFDWPPSAEGSYIYVNSFENKYSIETENGKPLDVGSQTQIIKKDESTGAIRKKATTDSNNIITYSVVLNAYGRDLVENTSTLTVHDELTYTSTAAQPLRVRLVPGSVKLYEIDLKSDGSYEKLGEVTANYSYNESSTEQSGVTTWVQTLDLTIPDGKALLLEYSYKATGIKNESYNILNNCTITGVGEGSLDGDHRLDLLVKDSEAQADSEGIMIYKVDASSDGLFLENAKFNIYIWNPDVNNGQGDYIIVHHPDGTADFTTNASGMIVLDGSTINVDQFAYNTAYYIVEVESPNGYFLSPERYYFYLANENTDAHPFCLPANFAGHALTNGDIIYRKNVSAETEISIEKFWLNYVGESMTVTGEKVKEVTIELWQELENNPTSAKLYGTYTMTPDANGNWKLTITHLPKASKNEDGTRDITYLYYVKEVKVNGYTLDTANNNTGINSGVITLINREQEGYILPETGGSGTALYTMAGSLLMLTSAAYLMYNKYNRRREDN